MPKTTYPSWNYKSRKTFLKSKKKEWDAFVNAGFKFYEGSAFVSKRLRDIIEELGYMDQNIAEPYFKRAIKRANNPQ